MTFDKSGQDTSLNVRVGVQVPNRGVTWFHLCIICNVQAKQEYISIVIIKILLIIPPNIIVVPECGMV